MDRSATKRLKGDADTGSIPVGFYVDEITRSFARYKPAPSTTIEDASKIANRPGTR